jgi:hypothetical protein
LLASDTDVRVQAAINDTPWDNLVLIDTSGVNENGVDEPDDFRLTGVASLAT